MWPILLRMAARTGTAHVVTTIRKYKDRVYRTHLLRRSYREGGSVKNETLGNLSHLPDELVDIIRRSLQGESFVPLAQNFEIACSRAHGHVHAVSTAMQRLSLASLIAAKPCRERDLVLAMVASRIVAPHTKLATTRWWHTTTLAEDFAVSDASEDDLYAAMDWLLQRQGSIEKKLAARHLSPGGLVLYDLSSSYFEGTSCSLARRGYNRDGKRGLLQVNYGLVTDGRGCPVAVSVHAGNTADSTTFMPEVQRLRTEFGIERMVMVGDRGMISHQAIDEMRQNEGIDWITALKSVSWLAAIHSSRSCARTSARSCWARPRRASPRSSSAWTPPSSPVKMRSACAWAKSSTSIRSPSTSSSPSARRRSHSGASATVSPLKPRWTASTSFAPRFRRGTWMPPTVCATTSRWPTLSAPSARSRPSI